MFIFVFKLKETLLQQSYLVAVRLLFTITLHISLLHTTYVSAKWKFDRRLIEKKEQASESSGVYEFIQIR